MDTFTLFYLLAGSLFLVLLYILKPRTYYWARLRGYCTGENTPTNAQQMILQDIRRARKEVLVASCTAGLSYWTDDIVALIQQKATRRKHPVRFTFLIGPKCENTPLIRAAASTNTQSIALRSLVNDPPYDFRIIDRNATYACNHGYNDTSRRFFRTFGNGVAVEQRLKDFAKLLVESKTIDQ